jgi:hypothetical protein
MPAAQVWLAAAVAWEGGRRDEITGGSQHAPGGGKGCDVGGERNPRKKTSGGMHPLGSPGDNPGRIIANVPMHLASSPCYLCGTARGSLLTPKKKLKLVLLCVTLVAATGATTTTTAASS